MQWEQNDLFCPEERHPRAAVARWHIYNKEWWRSCAACRPPPSASPSAGTHGNGRCRVKSTLHRPLGCSSPPAREWRKQRRKGLALAVYFVRNGQLLAALGTTSGQYAATISRLHALTETMFVVSLAVVGLECSFHCVYAVFCLLSWTLRTARTEARATAAEGRRGGSSIFGVQRYANFLKCRKVLA